MRRSKLDKYNYTNDNFNPHISNLSKLIFDIKLKKNNDINNSINNNYSSFINFFLAFSTGQKYQVNGNIHDTFQSVYDRFMKEQCPSIYKNKITSLLFMANRVDKNKKLYELGIKEGSIVVLYIGEINSVDHDTCSVLTKLPINEESDQLLQRDDDEQKLLKDINKIIKDYIENKVKKKSIPATCKTNNLECSHIHMDKHEHGLVLLFSNGSKICNECNTNYSEDYPKYYCSLCDYSVYDCCIGFTRKFPLTKFYHQQTRLKNFKFPFHQHNMIYCRTSRKYNKLTEHYCHLCQRRYSNKIWSFYCTICDYDVCLKCSKSYIDQSLLIFKNGIKIDNHEHDLFYMVTNRYREWDCRICKESFYQDPSYYCTKCDYDVCKKCMEKISDEEKYPLDNIDNKDDELIEKIKYDYHPHTLIYCITSRADKIKTIWYCKECKTRYDQDEWSFFCSVCEYDLCYNCYSYKDEFNYS